jgi:pantoate--beta-alanine ligase
MGALHEGHLSLFRRAKGDCDIAIVSVFVNPLQFNNPSDLAAYPRDLNRDMQLMSREGIDAVFAPGEEEMYPPGFQTTVDVSELTQPLEGEFRPGHFKGVATVVAKLLSMVMPERVYFGLKDYQQLLVIERLVRDLNMPITVVGLPTIRDVDNVAISSRNVRLSPEDRMAAGVIPRALACAVQMAQSGETSVERIQRAVWQAIAAEPRAAIDYVSVVDADTLQPLTTLRERTALVAVAVRFGEVRLIDNELIAPEGIAVPKIRISRPV